MTAPTLDSTRHMFCVTPRAHRLRQLVTAKDEVLTSWQLQVRREVPHACSVPLRELTKLLPTLYERLVRTMVGEGAASDYLSIAAEHGCQRARVTRFHAGSVVHELQLFHRAMLDAWGRTGIRLDSMETRRLDSSFELALREALTSFSFAEVRIREEFFCALTHDLRTPLATASAAVDLLQRSQEPARIGRLAEMARRNQHALGAMIDDMLDMIVGSAETALPELCATELHVLTADIVENISLSSRREIRLTSEPARIKCYPVALRRVLENLLNNAVKYSDDDTPIAISLKNERSHVVVAVANTGPAIPTEQLEAIFQLFRRAQHHADRGIAGWGIGLPYVRSIAERHRGSISVQSDDSTTTFALTLPFDPAAVDTGVYPDAKRDALQP